MNFTEEELKKYKKEVDPKFGIKGIGLISMYNDLSWRTWYGFSLFIGLRRFRDVETLAISYTGNYKWVKDIHTNRHFIMRVLDGTLIQFTRNDLRPWAWKKI